MDYCVYICICANESSYENINEWYKVQEHKWIFKHQYKPLM